MHACVCVCVCMCVRVCVCACVCVCLRVQYKVTPLNCVSSYWSSWSLVKSSSIISRRLYSSMFGSQKCPHAYENNLCSNCPLNY